MQTESSPRLPLSRAGSNCWRVEHADRFKLLVDADAYFSAVRAAMREARESVYILGWDIDSRTQLVPGGADDGLPGQLGEFLFALVEARPQLTVHVLNWDFAMLYALEREWMPAYKLGLGWRKQNRLIFRADGQHPVGASHHQKIVVVDDRIAFVGGLDLTRCRWDTSDHACDNPLRIDPDGKPYAPFHDVHAMVDGDAARALGELARTRWQRAAQSSQSNVAQDVSTQNLPATDTAAIVLATAGQQPDIWPDGFAPDLTDFHIGIARTEPAFDGSAGVFEIRQLYLDAISRARRFLFFENQYFTSNVLCDALGTRLAEPDAPEVMMISPHTQSGWLEQATMGALRARIHQRLKAADTVNTREQSGAGSSLSDTNGSADASTRRYRMYCPHLPGLENGCLNVHSKVFAMDDELFCVGSANMSNRSMAFDTECNLIIEIQGDEAKQAEIRHAITGMRNLLLAEHLDVTVEQLAQSLQQTGSLHASAAALHKDGRTLRELDPQVIPELDALTQDNAVFDPERPVDADQVVAQYIPHHARKPVPRRMIGLGLFAVALVLLTLAWRFTPLKDWVNLSSLITLARSLDKLPFTPVIVIAAFVVAGTLMVPVTLLIAVAGVVFGPLAGACYAIVGVTLSALLGFLIGQWMGHDALTQMLGKRINKLSKRMAQRGIAATAVVRLLPIAPFTIVNVVAGASHLSLRDYLIGTLIGMVPGILLTVIFSHNLAEAIRHPSMETVAVLAGVTLLLMLAAFGLQRLFKPRNAAEA
ncbi:VTT domain-containing protein [Herbaspirillum lusitanum]|uniref:VTT domain-containing protein n=1 Tax=Herbaspirillum lusitanum TaxID=213312 RepID=A0ABW9AFF2_9BURK